MQVAEESRCAGQTRRPHVLPPVKATARRMNIPLQHNGRRCGLSLIHTTFINYSSRSNKPFLELRFTPAEQSVRVAYAVLCQNHSSGGFYVAQGVISLNH